MLRAKTLPALRASARAQRRGLGTRRGLASVYRLLEVLGEDGLDLESMRGPWQVGSDQSGRRGKTVRGRLDYVELGRFRVYVDSERRARELAGCLNWCEVGEEELTEFVRGPNPP